MATTLKVSNLRARPVLVPFKRPPTCHWLEFMDWAEPVLQEPVRVDNGWARIPERLGARITWNADAVKRYAA